MPIDIIGFINIFIAFINILLGVVVLFSNLQKPVNKAYFYCTLTIGLWSLSLFFYDNPVILSSMSWLKIVYIISYLMTFAQIYFVLKFYGDIAKKSLRLFLFVLGIFFALGLYLLLIKDSVILNTLLNSEGKTVIAQMSRGNYVLYFLPIIISLVFLFYMHITKGSKQEGLHKKQSQYYWIAGFCMIIPLFIFDFVLPVFFDNTMFYKYSPLGNILWSLIIAYSIYNTRFLDVRLVLGKFMEFLFKSTYIFLLLLFLSNWLISRESLSGINLTLTLVGVSIFFSLILNLLNQKTEKVIQKNFIYSKYDPVVMLQSYSSANSEELSIEGIVKNTKKVIQDSVCPEKYSVLLFDKKDLLYRENQDFGFLDSDVMKEFLSNWSNLNSSPLLISSEIDIDYSSGKEIVDDRKKWILDFMNKYKIEIIIPLQLKSEMTGLLVLGYKKDNSLYSLGDIGFLEGIVKNLNIALGRSFLYLELQSFNETLKEKVNEQTKELQVKVEQLEEARRKERDMIDIMGHELRTPATVVKINVELLQKYIGSNPEEFKKYLDRIRLSIDNEIKLINTLLSSAKLEGDKIEINREEVNVVEEVEMAMHGHQEDSTESGLKLVNKVKSNIPCVYADKARLVEILNNLLDNGIKYTSRGSVTIEASSDNEFVYISVIDTGSGISKEEIPKLGQKFYRVSNYIEGKSTKPIDIVRPGGTGLGLYVTFNLVKLMGGKINVQSEVGKGTNFTFSLPLYKNQDSERKMKSSNNMFERLGLQK